MSPPSPSPPPPPPSTSTSTSSPAEEMDKAERRSVVRVDKKSWVWNYIWRLTHGPLPNRSGVMCEYVCKICYDRIGVAASDSAFRECLVPLYNHNASNGESHLKFHHKSVIPVKPLKSPKRAKHTHTAVRLSTDQHVARAATTSTKVVGTETSVSRVIEPVSKRSWVWNYIWKLTHGPLPNRNGSACEYVCKLCYDRIGSDALDDAFQDCLVPLYRHNSSNGESHLKSHHKDIVAARTAAIATKEVIDADAHVPSTGTALSIYTKPKVYIKMEDQECVAAVHAAVARLVVNHRLPLSFGSHNDLTAVIDVASRLTPGYYQSMTRAEMDAALSKMFADFVARVRSLIEVSRGVFAPNGRPEEEDTLGWLTVCRDEWSSTHRSFHRISVHWIDPVTWVRHTIALDLAVPDGDSANASIETALSTRFGIVKSDVYRSIINGERARGYSISESDGSCLHKVVMAVDYATGRRSRSRKEVFPACDSIRRKIVMMMEWIFNQHAVVWQDLHKIRDTAAALKTIRTDTNGDVVVVGTHNLFQLALRSMHQLRAYFDQQPSSARQLLLSEEEWTLVAGYEAALRPIAALSDSAHNGSASTAGTSWLAIVQCKMKLMKHHLTVVDVSVTDKRKVWDVVTSFHDLPKKKIAVVDLDQNVQTLGQLLLKELETMFPEPDDNQCIAMATDPVMLTTGFPFLRRLGHDALVDRALDLFRQQLEKVVGATRPTEAVLPNPPARPENEEYDSDDLFNSVMRKRPAVEPKVQRSSNKSHQEIVQEAYDAWVGQSIHWDAFLLLEQRVALSEVEKVKATQRDCFFLADKVDILLWFRINSSKHPQVAHIAASELAGPDANFLHNLVDVSRETANNELYQHLSPDQFEILTMLTLNKEFNKSWEAGRPRVASQARSTEPNADIGARSAEDHDTEQKPNGADDSDTDSPGTGKRKRDRFVL
ncbi:TPA: hypothetical protein N0F65_010523 [Lagenidium giganteum]|uniref:BED-type domain-containing protein n=1 Tax=Lagenidium giganteum TaxID=4803 RepID=A0AAV2Z5P3_9STRA|nr:TPA: hypothetical protein N0F65_010523 [Lagenidium giganteum]